MALFDGKTGELEYINFAGRKFFRRNVFHDVRERVRGLLHAADSFVSDEIHVDVSQKPSIAETVPVTISYLPHVVVGRGGCFMATAGAAPQAGRDYTSRNERLWELLILQGCDSAQHADAVIELGARELGLQSGSLVRVEQQRVVNEYVVGELPLRIGASIPRSQTLSSHIAQLQKTFACDDTETDPEISELNMIKRGGVRSFISVPLKAADQQWVLTLSSPHPRPFPFIESDRHFAELIGTVLARLVGRRETDERLEFLAFFDPLTGLPNRSATLSRLHEILATAERGSRSAALMFLDIDGFKQVNDTLGHSAGDTVLVDISQRFRSALRKGEYVGRVGGDEFAILFPEFSSGDQIQEAAERIATVLARPFEIHHHSFELAASIGISVFPTDAVIADELLACADAAMYRAKQGGGKNICWYSAGLHQELEKKRELSDSLRSASMNNEFLLCYQPIEDASGKLAGAEALLRWLHPSKGLLSPSTFMEMATQSKLVSLIDSWVLSEVLNQAHRWKRIGYGPRIYVNVSGVEQFLLSKIDAMTAEHRFDPSAICLEMSETVIMRDFVSSEQFLEGCRIRGMSVGIDRFGAATSSIKQLARLPIAFAKLDHGLVDMLFRDSRAASVLDANVQIAKSLGWRIIAEGVETERQREWLVAQGVDGLQGYSVGYPLTGVDFESRLRYWAGAHDTPA